MHTNVQVYARLIGVLIIAFAGLITYQLKWAKVPVDRETELRWRPLRWALLAAAAALILVSIAAQLLRHLV